MADNERQQPIVVCQAPWRTTTTTRVLYTLLSLSFSLRSCCSHLIVMAANFILSPERRNKGPARVYLVAATTDIRHPSSPPNQ